MADPEQIALLDDWKRFKRWYPVVLAVLGVAGALITATHYVDDNVVTKSDLKPLVVELHGLRSDIAGMKASLREGKISDTAYRQTVDNGLANVADRVTRIERALFRTSFVGEHKNTPNSKPSITY